MTQLTLTDSLTLSRMSTGIAAYDAILSRLDISCTYGAVKAHLDSIAQSKAPATVALHKAAIKKAITSAITDTRKLAEIDRAFQSIKVPRAERAVKSEKVVPAQVIEALVANTTDRRRVAYLFLAATGCRIAELSSLRIDRCKTAGAITYCHVIGKGKKERTVFISTELYREIRAIYQGAVYLFESTEGAAISTRYWRKAMDADSIANHVDINPHMLRHTFATKHLKAGKTLKAVSQYLGHASCATTADMYTHDELTPADLGIGA